MNQTTGAEEDLKARRRRVHGWRDGKVLLGRSKAGEVYASLEEPMLLLGPPSSGKSVRTHKGAEERGR